MLPKVNIDIISSFIEARRNKSDIIDSVQMYEEMYEQQPVFEQLILCAIQRSGWNKDKIDGYCKGMLHAWHLLNQQSIIEELRSSSRGGKT